MSTARESPGTSYDEVPYDSHPYPQSHPDRLATNATLFGLAPPPLETCRVLELGCSSGGNILPIAEQLPGSTCVGIDASSRQIADGQRFIESLGIPNVRLLHRDILDVGPDFGQFDYILCHGVYSWVPENVQNHILQICSQNLAPNGVAYVSYNTYPGWRMRGMIRDAMVYRASFFSTPGDQLREAQSLLDFLAESVPTKDNAYGILLRDEVGMMRGHSKSYLYHDHLEKVNEPTYFHVLNRRAEEKGLQYLAESDFSTMWANNFPPQVESMLKRLSSDVIQMEQYMDFVRNRMFRQTLLCHRDIRLVRDIAPERIADLYVASSAEPKDRQANLLARTPLLFVRPGSTLTTHDPVVKVAMFHLREVWPQRVRFRDLLAIARNAVYPGVVARDVREVEREARDLAQTMIRCYATSHVDLHVHPSRATTEAAAAPLASSLARRQAKDGVRITNLWHQSIRIGDLERHLLRYLDGTHGPDKLIAVLEEEVAAKRLILHDHGRELDDPSQIRASLHKILKENLMGLAQKGVLLSV